MKTKDKWQAEREHFAKGGRVEFELSPGQWLEHLRDPNDPNKQPIWESIAKWRIRPDDLKPVESPAPQEKCPTCGSVHDVIHYQTGPGPESYFTDPWHDPSPERALHEATQILDPQPPQEKWEPKDWHEDFSHENGNYINVCFECKQTFKGHKRRVVCKVCDAKLVVPWSLPTPPAGQQWHRTDGWKAEWLPDGTRPLLLGEEIVYGEGGDEYHILGDEFLWQVRCVSRPKADSLGYWRTRRPLPPTQPATAKTGDDLRVFTLCPHAGCNKESEVPMSLDNSGRHSAFYNCPSCGKRIDMWLRIPPFASSAETQENLLAPDESNIQYWTQRIMDLTEDSHTLLEQSISNVIRELLTKDTHYAANEMLNLQLQAEQKMATEWHDRAEAAEQKVKQLEGEADRIAKHVGAPTLAEAFDVLIRTKAQDEDVIAQQFATIKRQASEVQTADALRREVENLKGERDNAIKHWNEALRLIPVPPSTEEKPPIITTHVCPPIPMRHHDWCAYRQGQEDGLLGWGLTEDLAKADLINQEES